MDLKERSDNQNRHPWELARARMIQRIFHHFCCQRNNLNLLDVGCGDGFILNKLLQEPTIMAADGLDIFLSQEELGRMSKGNAHYYNKPEQLNEGYDVILLLDILEHINDDKEFLCRVVAERSKPGSIFIITAPAFQFLFSSHDHFLDHKRRYSLNSLRLLVQSAGLELVCDGPMFLTLLFPRVISQLREKISFRNKKIYSGVGKWGGGRVLTNLIVMYFNMENFFLWTFARLGIRLPGLTLWSVARRPL